MLSFIKYNLIAILATLLDFTLFVVLTQLINVWYVPAAVISAVSGGLFAFWYNRKWVFENNGKIYKQAIRYVSIWFTSIFLNTLGIYLLVHNGILPEINAKILVSLIVGVFFNFLMNKYYVFTQHT